MSNRIPIRKTIIGGFDKKQVDEYLDSLVEEYESSATQEDLDEAQEVINQLKEILRQKEERLAQLQKAAAEAAEAAENDSGKPRFTNITASAKKITDAHNEVVEIADRTRAYIKSAEVTIPDVLKGFSDVSDSVQELIGKLSELSEQLDAVGKEEKEESDG